MDVPLARLAEREWRHCRHTLLTPRIQSESVYYRLSCPFAVRGWRRAAAYRECFLMDSACQHDGKMLPHANYERIPVQSTRSAVFGSMLVDDKSNTPYSDATQVRTKNHTSFVDFVFGGPVAPCSSAPWREDDTSPKWHCQGDTLPGFSSTYVSMIFYIIGLKVVRDSVIVREEGRTGCMCFVVYDDSPK